MVHHPMKSQLPTATRYWYHVPELYQMFHRDWAARQIQTSKIRIKETCISAKTNLSLPLSLPLSLSLSLSLSMLDTLPLVFFCNHIHSYKNKLDTNQSWQNLLITLTFPFRMTSMAIPVPSIILKGLAWEKKKAYE